jgi:prepilin-type N-terminal cleavage/methylation domain-containing protein
VLMKTIRCGYTLIELSVVLVIISLLTAGGLTLGAGMVNQAAHIDTGKILNQIDQSLRDYYAVNGHLPCPAVRDLAITHADFGREVNGGSCTINSQITGTFYSNDVHIGMIPVRALGLSDRAASDKYGNRILYAVTRQLTDASTFGGDDGAIQVLPATGPEILNDAAYFVWSAGKDHKGAPLYTTGAIPTACAGVALDAENCDNDNIFRDAPFNNGEVVANFFDDHTRWVPKFHLSAMTATSDTLWSSNAGDSYVYSVGTDGQTGNTNVGIGEDEPDAKLTVVDSAFPVIRSIRSAASTNAVQHSLALQHRTSGNMVDGFGSGIVFEAMDNAGVINDLARIQAIRDGGDDVGALLFRVGDGDATPDEMMRITGGGQVRIGPATADNHLLTVSGTQNNGIKYLRTDGRDARIEVGDTTQSWSMASGWATAGDFSIIQEGVAGDRLYIDRSNGFVGMGLANPAQKLDVAGNIIAGGCCIGMYNPFAPAGRRVWRMGVQTAGADFFLGYRTDDSKGSLAAGASSVTVFRSSAWAPSDSIHIYSNGNVKIGGSVISASDRRLKKDILPLETAEVVEQLQALKPASYHWKREGAQPARQFGFIAQDVMEVWPNLVDGEGTDEVPYSLNYDGLIAPLVVAVQTLMEENKAIKAQLNGGTAIPQGSYVLPLLLMSLLLGGIGVFVGYRLARRTSD